MSSPSKSASASASGATFLKSSASASTSSLSEYSSSIVNDKDGDDSTGIVELTEGMSQRAKDFSPFTETELDEIIASLENVILAAAASASNDDGDVQPPIDLEKLKSLFAAVGHLSHKDWDQTGKSAQQLCDILLNDDCDGGLTDQFKNMFHRVIEEGNWNTALEKSKAANGKPWAVLVTGVNGIRKTTSVYQPWFEELLQQALVQPTATGTSDNSKDPPSLPTGHNSFFRQLDHMIATLTNHNFQKMYHLTSQSSHDFDQDNDGTTEKSQPSSEIIQNYSNYKAAIFTRYRTLSEILGVMLVRQARAQKLNTMIETSGRDVAMYHYVDTFFPSEEYNKLVLHFTINDLSHAESSVDRRMVNEMYDGIDALKSASVQRIIKANAGGPYGSEVLTGIQRDSDKVWKSINSSEGQERKDEKRVGDDWFKASIKIEASADKAWTAKAVLPDGTDGEVFTFEAPRKV